MISLLRRKRPTTPPNFRLSNSQGARVEGRGPAGSRWRLKANLAELAVLFAALFAAYVLLASTASAELQWQRGRTPSAAKAARAATPPKFVRAQAQHRVDAAVQQVAYEEEVASGPEFDDGAVGQARLRSVVVSREEEEASDDGSIRSAQLPFGDPPANAAPAEPPAAPAEPAAPPSTDTPQPINPTTPGSQFEEELRSPFGDLPKEQDLRTPGGTKQPGTSPATEPADSQLIDNPKEQIPRTVPRTGDRMLDPGEPAPGKSDTGKERQKAQEFCAEELNELKSSTLVDVSLSIAVGGTEGEDFPFECSIDDGTMAPGRFWNQTTYLWKASAMCHKPLYFEEEQLERYGHSCRPCFQPFVSGAHFFCTLPVLPYCMGVEPPMECIYALGHYRPGSCAPYMINPVPLSCRGALFQAGAVTGAAAAIP